MRCSLDLPLTTTTSISAWCFSADIGLHSTRQREKFVIGQGKDGVRNAAGSPQLVVLGERTIDDRPDGPWMADGSNTSDRLAGVFAYERRRGATERHSLLLSNLGHIHSMCTTSHDQQWRPDISFCELRAYADACSSEGFEDQRICDGSYRAPEVLSCSPCGGDRLIEHAHPTGQPGSLQDVVHGLAVRMHEGGITLSRQTGLVTWGVEPDKQKDPVIVTRSFVLSAVDLSNDLF